MNGPAFKAGGGSFLCPAAMTFSTPYFSRRTRVNSDPICPVAPVTKIFVGRRLFSVPGGDDVLYTIFFPQNEG